MRWAGLFEAYVELIQTLEAYRTEGKPIRQSSVSFEQVPRCNTENRTPQPPSGWRTFYNPKRGMDSPGSLGRLPIPGDNT